MKWYVKLLSVVMAIILMVMTLPLVVFAETGEASSPSGTDINGEIASGAAEATMPGEVYEVNSLREENVKHIHMADGSYLAVVYDNTVHFQDENGEWQEIDNRLTFLL